MIKWIRTSRLSIKNSPSSPARSGLHLHPGTRIFLLKESTKITTQTFLDVTCVQLFVLARFSRKNSCSRIDLEDAAVDGQQGRVAGAAAQIEDEDVFRVWERKGENLH